jgi:hypothetical protein
MHTGGIRKRFERGLHQLPINRAKPKGEPRTKQERSLLYSALPLYTIQEKEIRSSTFLSISLL